MVSKRGGSRQDRALRKMGQQSRDNDHDGKATRQRGERNHHAPVPEQYEASQSHDGTPAHLTRGRLPTNHHQHNPSAPAAIQRRRSAEANRLSRLAAARCKPRHAEEKPLLVKPRPVRPNPPKSQNHARAKPNSHTIMLNRSYESLSATSRNNLPGQHDHRGKRSSQQL